MRTTFSIVSADLTESELDSANKKLQGLLAKDPKINLIRDHTRLREDEHRVTIQINRPLLQKLSRRRVANPEGEEKGLAAMGTAIYQLLKDGAGEKIVSAVGAVMPALRAGVKVKLHVEDANRGINLDLEIENLQAKKIDDVLAIARNAGPRPR